LELIGEVCQTIVDIQTGYNGYRCYNEDDDEQCGNDWQECNDGDDTGKRVRRVQT
jgi:hypothetical protein